MDRLPIVKCNIYDKTDKKSIRVTWISQPLFKYQLQLIFSFNKQRTVIK